MKQASFLLLLCWLTNTTYAQNDKYSDQRELRGSGRLIQEDRVVAPFRAIQIGPFLSNVTIDVGGTQSVVHIRLDDNFKSFLRIENVDGVLKLQVKDPNNKPFWLGKGTIDITIKTPSLRQLQNESNGNVVINNLTGTSFDLTNKGNGNVTLRGSIDRFNVVSEANGDIRAKGLVVQQANIVTLANATVEINARQVRSQKMGQATIHNIAETSSRSTGRITEPTQSDDDLVTVILQNNRTTSRTVTLRFTEPGNPVYGVVSTTLGPYGKRRETYPVGTKIEQLDRKQQEVAMTGETVGGKPIITLKASDNGRTYDLPN